MGSKTLYYSLLTSATVLCAMVFFVIAGTAEFLWNPLRGNGYEFTIRKGTAHSDLIEKNIAEKGGLASNLLKIYTRASGLERRMKPGRYRILGSWSPIQIVEQVTVGTNRPYKVTFAPGFTLHQCAQTLESSGWISSSSAFIREASGPSIARVYGVPNLEGLFAPETYFFESEQGVGEVLAQLREEWRRFIEKITGTGQLREVLRNGLTLYETIILASILEREVADPVEMATASSVFHNRLRKGWPLGSAATLRYALNNWSGRDRDLPINLRSPFNTSKRKGLPPTPICIPGEAALRAALHPEDTDYMFFASDGKGGLVFNRSHREHIRSVKKYRKLERETPY